VRKMVGMNIHKVSCKHIWNCHNIFPIQLTYANKNLQRKKKYNHRNSQKSTNEYMVRGIGSSFIKIICAFHVL
jgi:hypothetical protein